jgi:hypothetical protein
MSQWWVSMHQVRTPRKLQTPRNVPRTHQSNTELQPAEKQCARTPIIRQTHNPKPQKSPHQSHRINPNKSRSSPFSVFSSHGGSLQPILSTCHSYTETTRMHPSPAESTNGSLHWLGVGAGEAVGVAADIGAILRQVWSAGV